MKRLVLLLLFSWILLSVACNGGERLNWQWELPTQNVSIPSAVQVDESDEASAELSRDPDALELLKMLDQLNQVNQAGDAFSNLP